MVNIYVLSRPKRIREMTNNSKSLDLFSVIDALVSLVITLPKHSEASLNSYYPTL